MMHPHFTAPLCRGARGVLLVTLCLPSALAHSQAQQPSATPELLAINTRAAFLPNAPSFERSRESLPLTEILPEPPEPQSTATIGGTVLDIREGMVPGAQVTLETPSGAVQQTETSDSAGVFLFKNVPAGAYRVRIIATGLQSFLSNEIIIHLGEHHELPRIALPIAASATEVSVTVTEDQIATEQVHAQLEQRALGVFPNFYTSFLWNPAPLKPRHKFYLAFRSTTDPMTFITTGIVAGVQQAHGTYSGYGDGIEGYAKRYGADYGNAVIARMIGGAILPSLFRQDPRYFYQGTGSKASRMQHALASTVVCRGDNGRNQPNFSYVLGVFAAAGISNLYYPDNDRNAGTIVGNAFLRIGAHAGQNLVREFVLRGITHKVPAYANGRPEATPAP